MDAADNDLRVLQGGRDGKHAKRGLRGQEVPTASYDSSARRLSTAGLFACCLKGQSSGRTPARNRAAIRRQDSMTESQRRDITFVNQIPLAHRQNRGQERRQGQAGADQGRRQPQRQESMDMSGPLGSPGSSGRYSRQSSSGRRPQRQESMHMSGPLGSPGSSGRYSRQSSSGRSSS
ncbi:hypothetical protein AC1031_006337 [Aphanomyces cochlioides]|nr:hypothetical protein AC1031_006337 [Aphanomyces cochlioides]